MSDGEHVEQSVFECKLARSDCIFVWRELIIGAHSSGCLPLREHCGSFGRIGVSEARQAAVSMHPAFLTSSSSPHADNYPSPTSTTTYHHEIENPPATWKPNPPSKIAPLSFLRPFRQRLRV